MSNMFERRHYNAIAGVLRECSPLDDDYTGGARWGVIKETLSKLFMRDNPRFDRFRFEDACEYRRKGERKVS